MLSVRSTPADGAPLAAKTLGPEPLPAVSGKGEASVSGTFASLLKLGGAGSADVSLVPAEISVEIAEHGKILPDGSLPGKIAPVAPHPNSDALVETAAEQALPADGIVIAALALTPALPAAGSAPSAKGPNHQPAQTSAKRALPQGATIPIGAAEGSRNPAAPIKGELHTAPSAAVAKAVNAKPALPMTAPPTVPMSNREELGLGSVIPRPITPSIRSAPMPGSAVLASEPVLANIFHSAAPTSAAPDSAAQAPIAARDFEALIDRLSQAREAAQPSSARVSLAHAEFGQVNLRFDAAPGAPGPAGPAATPSTGSGSVSVTMTSHDPDFALVARAALAERTASAPEQPRGDNLAPGTGQHQNNAQTQQQSSGNPRPQAGTPVREQGHDPNGRQQQGDELPNARQTENRGLYA